MNAFVGFFGLLVAIALTMSCVEAGYTAMFEKIEPVYLNDKIYKGNVSTTRHNDSTLIVTVFHEFMNDIASGDVKIKVGGYKFNGKTYELTPLQLDLEYCMTLKSSDYGDINKNTNVPNCPVPKGVYWSKEVPLVLNLEKHGHILPPNAAGKWKIQMDYAFKGTKYMQYNIFLTINQA